MPTTTKWGLTYPAMTDGPAGATQIQTLATAVDGALPQSGTLAARSGITHHVGLFYYATDTKQLFMSDGAAWLEVGIEQSIVPLGGLIDYAGATAPTSIGGAQFMLPDGAAISRSTFSALFTLIGSTFGSGDGSTTFNIPDLRGRIGVTADNLGTAAGAASRLPNTNRVRGQTHGEEVHSLTSGEMPNHAHADASGGTFLGNGPPGGGYAINSDSASGGLNGIYLASGSLTQNGFTAGNGSSQFHNNMQPGLVLHKLLRVK